MRRYPELENLDRMAELLRCAVLRARTMTTVEGIPNFHPRSYEHGLQVARTFIKEARERRAEDINWEENVVPVLKMKKEEEL